MGPYVLMLLLLFLGCSILLLPRLLRKSGQRFIESTFTLPSVQQRGSVAVILGAGGFIGSHFVRNFATDYDVVLACDIVRPMYHQSNVYNVHVDILRSEQLATLLDYCATTVLDPSISPRVHVVNAVGYIDMRTHGAHVARGWRINVQGAQSLCTALTACSKQRFQLVSLSSASVYHHHRGSSCSSSNNRGYAAQKLAAEPFVLGVDGVVLRPSKVYGRGDWAHGTEQLLSGKMFPLIGNGTNRVRFCNVKTLTEFAKAALKTDSTRGQVLFVGDEESSSLRSFCNALSGKEQPEIPVWILRSLAVLFYVVDLALLIVGKESSAQFLQLTSDGIRFALVDDSFDEEFARAKKNVPNYIPPFKSIHEGILCMKQDNTNHDTTSAAVVDNTRLFQPLSLGGLKLRNRCIKSATFEGMSGDRLAQFHAEVARGGAAMTTVAYLAISAAARSFPHQNVVGEQSFNTMKSLAEAVHREGALVCGQLTHAGFFSLGGFGPTRQFDKLNLKISKKMTLADEDRICSQYVKAALLLERAQFDVLEIHCGHGYLLSQYLHERKMDFVIRVISSVREALKQTRLIVKMNTHDGVSGGVDLNNALKFALALQKGRLVDALVPSGGMAQSNGFYMLRGPVPVSLMISSSASWWMKLALYFFGWTIPYTKFHPLYFLEAVLFLRKGGVRLPIFVVGGISTLAHASMIVDEFGFEGVAMARSLLLNPNVINDWQSQKPQRFTCDHNNSCIVTSTFSGKTVRCKNRIDW